MPETPAILVVEANPEFRDDLELHLLNQGYEVVSTGNGLRAVELAHERHFQVALVDLLIPGQSGFRVAQDLKARLGESITVVVLSSALSAAHQDYAMAAGADRFLPKTLTIAEIGDVVASICPPPRQRPAPRRFARIGV
ncbi:MAG: response regulator [Gemmataceae bacterium]|nr:response regulator [Gemmata sp.]MDW8196347.1 response regulator [Gemmataceae bacterium]